MEIDRSGAVTAMAKPVDSASGAVASPSGGATAAEPVMLRAEDVTVRFGGLTALDSVTFETTPGEILGLIGPNGAGKTTLFNVISGMQPPTRGSVWLGDKQTTRLLPHQVASLGLVRTFQICQLFEQMSVLDNLRVGGHLLARPTLTDALIRWRRRARSSALVDERAVEVLGFLGLSDLHGERCRDLPHGTKQLVALAVALASRPRVLLLDEPLAGLTEHEIAKVLGVCRALRDDGIAIVLVEHNVTAVAALCDRIVVLDFGRRSPTARQSGFAGTSA